MGLASLLRPLVGRIHEADGGDFVTTVTGLEQLGFQKQKWNEECSYDFETYSQSVVAGSNELSKLRGKDQDRELILLIGYSLVIQ
ncbi:hypothetical protein C2S52_006807 [Perilla frutescens var. hirtella]|nr:hypothetical protein C2S52_006807 [Perilla frutescens var. hirtella]